MSNISPTGVGEGNRNLNDILCRAEKLAGEGEELVKEIKKLKLSQDGMLENISSTLDSRRAEKVEEGFNGQKRPGRDIVKMLALIVGAIAVALIAIYLDRQWKGPAQITNPPPPPPPKSERNEAGMSRRIFS
jgi:hypothetical protein